MLEIINVRKSYNNKVIIDDLSYSFNESGLYWLKGESGVGKTTLFNIISGRCSYLGCVNISGEVFFLSFNNYLIENFTVSENISIHRDLFKNFKEYSNKFSIEELWHKKVNKLSLGERQRVGLFIALSSGCDILLLDEILSGVDGYYKKMFLKEIKKVSKKKLVIVSSHQTLKNYDKVLSLVDGKIKEKNKDKHVEGHVSKRNLNNKFKWVMLLHKKQFLSRVLFLFSLVSSIMFFGSITKEITNFKEEFSESFVNHEIYYKNETDDKKMNVYEDVLVPLANEVEDEFYQFYSEGMYEAIISINDDYLGNGVLFSNINYIQGLKENEVSLVISKNEYCNNNGYVYCPKKEIENDLIGKKIVYKYGDQVVFYIIKNVMLGEGNIVYSSYPLKVIEDMENVYENNMIIKKYYLKIHNDKISSFNNKINTIDSLLHYQFHLVSSDEKYSYYLVERSTLKLFNENEIKDSYVCSDIGFSCSFIDFGNLISLNYIDLKSVDNIGYRKYTRDLSYSEVAISSSLSTYLGKEIGDRIDLKFYFDDNFHTLHNVKIIDVIESQDLRVYHNKYDYLLFKELFNECLRIEFIYNENDLALNKRDSLNYEFIKSSNVILEKILKVLEIVNILFFLIMMIILFVIESKKLRKQLGVFVLIERSNGDVVGLFNLYMIVYLLLGVITFVNVTYLFCYYGCFIIFYCLKKRKIKSRISLD